MSCLHQAPAVQP